MRQQYRESYVYKYADPFTAYLAEQTADECFGSVDDDGIWIGRLGARHVLLEDDRGTVWRDHLARGDDLADYVQKHHPYIFRDDEEEDEEEYPTPSERRAAAQALRDAEPGGLLDEVRYAESFITDEETDNDREQQAAWAEWNRAETEEPTP